MPRARPKPFAHAKTPRYVVLWDLNWHALNCVAVNPCADLHAALQSAIEQQRAEGWEPEDTADFGFVFLHRQRQRRLLMLTARHPDERAPQSFRPLK